MSAKSELLERLKYLNAAVNLPNLVDRGIAIDEHNGAANILRKGLGIVAFNILEDYVKNKSVEALNILSTSRVSFSDLTEQLQNSAVYGALNALVFKTNILKKDADLLTLIQEETLKIHSTSKPTFELSKLSLVSKGSNVSDVEINEFLRAFGIQGGWQQLKQISDRIGGGLPDLCQAYQNAASRRNNAAHTAAFQYNLQWLINIKNEIIAIAASIDILISARCRQVRKTPTASMASHNINDQLNFRFLEPNNTIYRETFIIGGRSKKNWLTLEEAINNLQPNLEARNEFLIVLNNRKQVEDWYE